MNLDIVCWGKVCNVGTNGQANTMVDIIVFVALKLITFPVADVATPCGSALRALLAASVRTLAVTREQ